MGTNTRRKFTVDLDRSVHKHLIDTSHAAGVSAADTIRALLLMRAEDQQLTDRTNEVAARLAKQHR